MRRQQGSLVVGWLSAMGMVVTAVSSGNPMTAWMAACNVGTSARELPRRACALLSGSMQLSLPLQNCQRRISLSAMVAVVETARRNSLSVMVAAVETAHPG